MHDRDDIASEMRSRRRTVSAVRHKMTDRHACRYDDNEDTGHIGLHRDPSKAVPNNLMNMSRSQQLKQQYTQVEPSLL